jgi:hypothetical protein
MDHTVTEAIETELHPYDIQREGDYQKIVEASHWLPKNFQDMAQVHLAT